jgi:very-short-patch-repair endonuclease
MRSALTPSEERLWRALRGSQLGVAFRRQVPIGSYIADFASPKARLVVEVDGGYHAGRERADARRDEALRRAGYRVVRVSAELVHRDLPAAVARIRAALGAAP